MGGFGPTGVTEAHRGAGLGKFLLDACLEDQKRMGIERCEIGWVGPVAFYARAAGAVLGPVYWQLGRKIGPSGI
jgi:GNAT superfamily N-acetyltransferase